MAKTAKKEEIKYTKEHILKFCKYAGRRDILSVLLTAGGLYTTDEVDGILDKFMKGKVR